jgi:hypothetical protein
LVHAYTEYANCKDGANVQSIDEDRFFYTVVHLPTVFFPPGKNTALAVSVTHEHFDLFMVHTLRLGSISYSVGIFKVDTVLMKEVHSLLLVV